ncbi:hypothetical protein Tco_1291670 [Tanacetum coccineum]
MPLLAEYSLQPPVTDAQSIVSNVKFLTADPDTPTYLGKFSVIGFFLEHLQEKLNGIETKLKESQYQLAAWHSDVNPSSFAQSPLYSFENKNGLELVAQQTYSDGHVPNSSDHLTPGGWDVPTHSGSGADNLDPDNGMYPTSHELVRNGQLVQI